MIFFSFIQKYSSCFYDPCRAEATPFSKKSIKSNFFGPTIYYKLFIRKKEIIPIFALFMKIQSKMNDPKKYLLKTNRPHMIVILIRNLSQIGFSHAKSKKGNPFSLSQTLFLQDHSKIKHDLIVIFAALFAGLLLALLLIISIIISHKR